MPQMDQVLSATKVFQTPILARSLGQLATSFGGFVATCTAMYLSLAVSLWITLPISVLAAGFLVRIFIIQHDCGHGSFFRSRWANDLIGSLCGLMTLTPYAFWRRQHARHHGSWNNLDRRAASGLDIYSSCMTVAEYRALGRWRRCLVRLVNHPIVANLLLPPFVFVILYRMPFDAAKGWRRERCGVYLTDIALVVLIGNLGVNAMKVVHPGLAWETVGCPPSVTQTGAPNEHPQECAVDAARSTPVGRAHYRGGLERRAGGAGRGHTRSRRTPCLID